jgi:glycosyltransferase involved in cell wall biosynthesis
MRVFREHDLFLFPTRGENFGHVIIESLSAGTPVLLANTTPWQNLEQFGVGWDLPLDNELEFVKRIEILARTSFEDREAQRRLVYSYAKIKSHEPDVLENNRNLFRYAVELGKLKQSKLLDWEAGRSGKSCAES